MKALLCFLLSGLACADLPRLTVEHGDARQDLRLDEVEVSVHVEGDFVETRMSLNFYNETKRNQEGEFRLPLPEGASVNHYALEVNDKMRAATVVERDQARRAYETIKARNIDPGLVEKMEGNVYRTRIFPVLPEQGKRVSIGYVQPLQKVDGEMVYQLPFGVKERIGKFRLTVGGDLAGVSVDMTSGAGLNETKNGFSLSTEGAPLLGDLVLKKKASDGGFSGQIREVDGQGFAYITGGVPKELAASKPEKPESLTVVWDASASGYSRDLKAEVEFLGKLIEELDEVTIQLLVVHGKVENLGEFRVDGGDWDELRTAIEGIFYDGAADWRKLVFSTLEGDQVLLFGGGESAFPISQDELGGILQIVKSSSAPADKILAEMADKSGGAITNLVRGQLDAAVKTVLQPRIRVVDVSGGVESYAAEIVEGRFRIFAKMAADEAESRTITVSLGRGAKVLRPVPVKPRRAKGGSALRYLWAQGKLNELVLRSSLLSRREKSKVVKHCQKYGLVSDFTSLIVLERMEDHIEFRIPPPEPKLMAAYREGVARRDAAMTREANVDRVSPAWKSRIKWYKKKYPWMDSILMPRYLRVKKWTEAQTSVFEKEQLEQTNIAEFLAWRKDAEQVMRKSGKITDKEEFSKWMRQVAGLLKSGTLLGSKDAEAPEEGGFGVSVRGLVQEPGTVELKKGATLRQAIEKAGGLHAAGTASRVALYRSGRRSVYNLLSKKFKGVKLLPGDMVVAMPEAYYYSSNADPFSDSGGENIDPSVGPAQPEGDLPLKRFSPRFDEISTVAGIDPFADTGGRGSGTLVARPSPTSDAIPSLRGEVKAVELKRGNKQVVEEILEAQDPWESYKNRRSRIGDDFSDLATIAGKLYEKGVTERGRRVLGNFYSENGINVPSLRAAAYWMMQFSDWEGANEIFEFICSRFPEDALAALDLVRLERLAGSGDGGEFVAEHRSRLMSSSSSDSKNRAIAEMMLMERNRYRRPYTRSVGTFLAVGREVFRSDIRVVVTSSQPDRRTYLKVTEPTGESISGDVISPTGGRIVSGDGVVEFMIVRALPGEYQLQLAEVGRGACQVEIFLNWGRENETRKMFTLSGGAEGRLMDAGVVEFTFD